MKDVKVGDEIIRSSNGRLMYHKVLAVPGTGRLKSVKVSAYDKKSLASSGTRDYYYKAFEPDVSLHNTHQYLDVYRFTDGGVWLVAARWWLPTQPQCLKWWAMPPCWLTRTTQRPWRPHSQRC